MEGREIPFNRNIVYLRRAGANGMLASRSDSVNSRVRSHMGRSIYNRIGMVQKGATKLSLDEIYCQEQKITTANQPLGDWWMWRQDILASFYPTAVAPHLSKTSKHWMKMKIRLSRYMRN